MKSIIRRILQEETQKPTFQDVILKDVMNTFTKETVEDEPDILWRGGDIVDTFKQYDGVVNVANNLLIPHIENTYGLDIVKDREIIMPILAKWIRNMYYVEYPLPGDTIEMIKMAGEDPDPIIPGTKGIVDHIKTLRFGHEYEEHVDVNWENGRTLKLILPGDEIKIVDRILKEETISGREYKTLPNVSDKQQKVLDYAVKDIVDNIEIRPETLTYEHIDDVMDDPFMDAAVVEIMNNWREMDRRGWRVGEGDPDELTSDGPVFSKKNDPSRYMNQWDARIEIAVELMDELVEAGKFRRIGPEENEGRWGHVGWQSTYNDYDIIMLNRKGNRLKFALWYDPFRDFYYPHGIDEGIFESRIINYFYEMYGIARDETYTLFDKIKKGIRDRLEKEGINVNYETPYGRVLNEGVIDDFVDFTKSELGLDSDFTVELENDGDKLETLASYDIENNKVKVLSKNRALPDIIRSIAHELVHHKQNQEGELSGDKEEGADGSPWEDKANADAGWLVRKFGKTYPEIYDL